VEVEEFSTALGEDELFARERRGEGGDRGRVLAVGAASRRRMQGRRTAPSCSIRKG
jgi:hypothetical protein